MLVRLRAGAIKNCRKHRRYLNATQRAFLALEIEKIEAERAKERQEASRAKPGEQVGQAPQKIAGPIAETGDARAIAAKAVGANHSYVSAAKKLAKAAPKVAEAARRGKL
jgi:hypothetical protein